MRIPFVGRSHDAARRTSYHAVSMPGFTGQSFRVSRTPSLRVHLSYLMKIF